MFCLCKDLLMGQVLWEGWGVVGYNVFLAVERSSIFSFL